MGIETINLKFSFLICTRNSIRVLNEVIWSILNQDHPKNSYEIIVVDYCSSDKTLERARELVVKAGVDFKGVTCNKPGKSPALCEGFGMAIGDYIVIVDDDTILLPNYITEAKKIVSRELYGCIGAIGLQDKGLKYPDWFSKYSGVYAIGWHRGFQSVDTVWGAACLINRMAWEGLYKSGFVFQLNPARLDHSQSIAIGGEDGELSAAIKMIGYKVEYSQKLQFIHKFEQSRLSEEYLLNNTIGSMRGVPVVEIYRLLIHAPDALFPVINWNAILFKRIVGCLVRMLKCAFLLDWLGFQFHLARARGMWSGYLLTFKNFNKLLVHLRRIKSNSSID